MLGQQCCAGGLCEYAPGSGEIYSQRGISSKYLTKGFKTVREHWYQTVQCTWNVFTSPWSKLDQLAEAHQPQEAGILGDVLSGREPMERRHRDVGWSSDWRTRSQSAVPAVPAATGAVES
jgi:hypothetical protein